ncbi:MAG: hypothetical protein FD123_3747 [Bacteroidetes bacterium]|nr:MAG: hypothetical protein FD123_3747 [Bacteroidota bacterium]
MNIPGFITHYHYPDKKPFLNLGDLPEEERAPVIEELNAREARAETQRGFPGWYMSQRIAAEEKMHGLFIAKGGKPERKSPHYFTLGDSPMLEMIYKNNFRKVTLPVTGFDDSELCFSLGDSLWTMADSQKPGFSWTNRWFEGQLYTYDEAAAILRELKVDPGNMDSLKAHRLIYVEALLWSDHKIHPFTR